MSTTPITKPVLVLLQSAALAFLLSSPVQGKPLNYGEQLSYAALERTKHRVKYDGRYIKLKYPWGDVPRNIGVCTDVVIRTYRRLGIDLQSRVNEDMWLAFQQYPNLPKWKRDSPDYNIDHRRVLNLRVFFRRQGASVSITKNPNDYIAGDLVSWQMGPDTYHIGVVTHLKTKDGKRPLIVHNIGEGPKLEDILFTMKINGHFRYYPKPRDGA